MAAQQPSATAYEPALKKLKSAREELKQFRQQYVDAIAKIDAELGEPRPGRNQPATSRQKPATPRQAKPPRRKHDMTAEAFLIGLVKKVGLTKAAIAKQWEKVGRKPNSLPTTLSQLTKAGTIKKSKGKDGKTAIYKLGRPRS
ncbi:MAG: hypothetical protein GXY42_00245 [Desulfovibrionales bacterium]|nr:hypothetical protein [Desulfovibrionales bacterium]